MKKLFLLGLTLTFLHGCGVKSQKKNEVSSTIDRKENIVHEDEGESIAQFQNESIDKMYNIAYEASYRENPESLDSVKSSDEYKKIIENLEDKLKSKSIDQTQHDHFVLSLNGAIKLAYNTGKQVYMETEVETPEVENVRTPQSINDVMYTTAVALNVRSQDAFVAECGNCVGKLPQNTKVSIDEYGKNGYVKIFIIDETVEIDADTDYWISKSYLSKKKTQLKVAYNASTEDKLKYFVIQNIATERLRVYEKGCNNAEVNCKHNLILDIPIVAGQPTEDKSTNTIVGNFYISKWWKFYEDNGKLYPSWYKAGYPDVPEKGADLFNWLDSSVLPESLPQAQARGAFGWYTAHLAPNAHAQWMHGTYGWGDESVGFIHSAKNFFYSNIAKMAGAATRSHGCSRMSNPAVAYLFEKLPVGTPVIKVYAKEKLKQPLFKSVRERRKFKSNFENWHYILTKRSDIMSSDKDTVDSKNLSSSEIIDEGIFTLYSKPKLITSEFHSGVSNLGNLYDIPEDEFQGTFYIDVGLLEDYKHPAYLTVGGKKELYPSNLEYKLK